MIENYSSMFVEITKMDTYVFFNFEVKLNCYFKTV